MRCSAGVLKSDEEHFGQRLPRLCRNSPVDVLRGLIKFAWPVPLAARHHVVLVPVEDVRAPPLRCVSDDEVFREPIAEISVNLRKGGAVRPRTPSICQREINRSHVVVLVPESIHIIHRQAEGEPLGDDITLDSIGHDHAIYPNSFTAERSFIGAIVNRPLPLTRRPKPLPNAPGETLPGYGLEELECVSFVCVAERGRHKGGSCPIDNCEFFVPGGKPVAEHPDLAHVGYPAVLVGSRWTQVDAGERSVRFDNFGAVPSFRSSIVTMSDETRHLLDEATTTVTAVHAKADARKQECLDVIADGLPAAVERLAKHTAQAQPEVTKALGANGVRTLRKELDAEATELAEYIRAGSGKIVWPTGASEWSKVEPRKIHSALFTFMYGAPVNRVGDVFGRHGYDVRRTERSGEQGLVLPQDLYDEEAFGVVADALNELGTAEIALKKAKEADDREIVDSLWDEA